MMGIGTGPLKGRTWGIIAIVISAAASNAVFADDGATAAPTGTDVPTVVLPDEAMPEVSPASDAVSLSNIEVTGSRIPRAGFITPAPVTVMSAEDIRGSGAVTLGDLLNELPQLGSTFSLGNSTRFIGTAGLNLLDLRRMGTDRTLVLINGRRHVSGSPGSAAVDVNTIPVDLIERVEIMTGGASAVYGSDAVTGAVNFILKKDFDGVSMSAQKGEAGDSDFSTELYMMTAGKSFDAGRGNAVFSIEHSRQNRLNATERSSTRTPVRLVMNPENTGPGDGVADEIYVQNAGLYYINTAGVLPGPFVGLPGGFYTFDPDGTFRPVNTGTDYGDFECGPAADGTPCDFLDLRPYEDLQPKFERTSLNTLFRYDLDDDTTMVFEGKYATTDATFFSQPSFDFFPGILINRDNAFLPDDMAAYMDDPDGDPTTDDSVDQVEIFRFNSDAGLRGEDTQRQTYRLALGLEGGFLTDWRYDVSAVYGRTTANIIALNNRINDRFFAATDAVIGPDNAPACRVTVDPNATLPDGSPQPSYLDAANCTPISIFGENAIDPNALGYFNVNSNTNHTITQQVLSGSVSNPYLLDMPAGPLGFAGGLEYRKEMSQSNPDPLSALGITFLNAIQPEQGEYRVKEIFAEFRVPLLAQMPGVQQLDLGVAARYADYDSIGAATAWNTNLDYQVIDDLRLRASLSEAIRAPNISELFGALSQNFFTVTDPCSDSELANGKDPAVREANCVALGKPDDYESALDAASIDGFSGGNPDLQEETAKTWTLGAVVTPTRFPTLMFSIDLWNIEIEDSISTVEAQDILDRCVDDPGGVDNQFCSLITRNPSDGSPVQFELTNILQVVQNVARLEASGIDFEAVYGLAVPRIGGNLNIRLTSTYLDNLTFYPFQSDLGDGDEEAGEIGDPQWLANLNLNYVNGPWNASWETRFIDQQLLVENHVAAANPESRSPLSAGSVLYHDLQVRYAFNGGLEVFGGIDNVLDKDLPVNVLGNDGDSSIYDNIGRFFYLGVGYEFD